MIHVRHRELAPAALCLLAAVACNDLLTDPKPVVTVTLAQAAPPISTITETTEGVRVACTVPLRVQATGEGTATLLEGTLRFYIGPNRIVPADSQPIAAAEVEASWGRSVTAPVTRDRVWRFSANIPFEAEIELRYAGSAGDPVQRTSTRFPCGPLPLPGTTSPPTALLVRQRGTASTSSRCGKHASSASRCRRPPSPTTGPCCSSACGPP